MKSLFVLTIIVAGVYCLEKQGTTLFPGENWNSGYIHVGDGNNLFYYLFKCRNSSIVNPPLVIWIEGGPGYTTELGVYAEGGPYIVNNKTLALERNKYAWNEIADTLFIDQPAGTSFSYAMKSERICRTEGCVANDFYSFLIGFFNQYSEYKKRPLYVTGVSYGGHYVPAIAGHLIRANNPDINLKGIGIANGLVDLYTQLPSYPEFLYQNGLINFFQYIGFHTNVFICNIFKKIHYESTDWNCSFSFFKLYYNRFNISVDAYDIKDVDSGFNAYEGKLSTYLNDPSVQKEIGVSQRFELFNASVYNNLKNDWSTNLSPDVTLALEKGIKVSLFHGENDYVCNWIGAEYLADSLQWSGRDEYMKQQYKDWPLNGVNLAKVKRYKNFALTLVHDAGHSIFFKHRDFALELLKDLIK